ncbi:MAG: proton-conducting transporter membrane subunit [Nitrospirales bacterium]
MEGWLEQAFIVMAIPLLGAVIGTFFWSKPQAFKIWGLLVVITTWLAVAVHPSMSDAPSSISIFLIHMILLAGFLTILGQHPNKEAPISLCLALLFTGLGIGFLLSEGHAGSIMLGAILGLLIVSLVRHRRLDRDIHWSAMSLLALGILSLILSMVYSGPYRIFMLLLPLVLVWPLWPLQAAFVSSVSCLPGMLPAFLAVLLPSVGFYGFTHLLPVLPAAAFDFLWVFAIASALYGSLLALSQDSVDTLLAYAHSALGAILWWYVAVTQSVGPGTLSYLTGLNLVICGLLLASLYIRLRFGSLDLQGSHGLAHTMPTLATLFVLFITAALGLPVITLLSAFMKMMLDIPSSHTGSLVLVLLSWLLASWYFPRLMQQVLFGPVSPQCQAGGDLHVQERLSLILLLVVLVALGMAPFHWFGVVDSTVHAWHYSFEIAQDGRWTV